MSGSLSTKLTSVETTHVPAELIFRTASRAWTCLRQTAIFNGVHTRPWFVVRRPLPEQRMARGAGPLEQRTTDHGQMTTDYGLNRLSKSAAFVPPKPKEFERAYSIAAGRARFAT